MAYSLNDYVAGTNSDGSSYTVTTSTVFVAPSYLGGREATDIIVQVAGVTKVKDTDYTITNNEVKFLVTKLPAAGAAVRIQRRTSQSTRLVDYTDATLLKADTMDADANQLFFMAQEALDLGDFTTGGGVTLSSTGKIVGLGDVKIKPATGDDVVLDSSLNFARVKSTETSASLYFGANAGASAEKLQTTNTGITVTGNVAAVDGNFSGGITTSSLSLTHTTPFGFISGKTILRETASGDFRIEGEDLQLNVSDGSSPSFGNNAVYKRIDCAAGSTGSVELWHGANDKKLETTATGVTVTGTITADGVSLGDNEKIQIGNTQDLELFHDGTNSYVQDAGDGGLILNTTSGNGVFINSATETMGAFHTNGAVNLYHDNVEKFATTATGINVTGDVAATTVTIGDSTGTNLELYEDSDQNAIIRQRGTGSLQITGINGSLSNDAYEQLLTWGNEAIHLSWQGAGTKGERLRTTNAGIDVTGTVTPSGGYNSSDGTAGYTGSAAASATLTIKNGLIVAVS